MSELIQNINDLEIIKNNLKTTFSLRNSDITQVEKELIQQNIHHVMLCFGTGCISSGAEDVKQAMKEEIEKYNISDKITLVETGCNGFCAGGPIAVVYPGAFFYTKITPEDARKIVSQHLVEGQPVESLVFQDPNNKKGISQYNDIPFFSKQNPKVLRNKGMIAAESLEEAIGRGAYFAIEKALREMTPVQIIEEVKKSGLRGRGGAGFLTGLKWEFCSKAQGDIKYIICNADEGDPGAFMDRSLLESDPHAVIEGMMIAARAIGSSTGYVYCRAEYPLAIKRLNVAIEDCRRRGLLGNNIFGSDFSFDLHISQGAGAFVCGEETALMRSIEGKRGEPRQRPPFPANQGLWEKPSVLNNVETLGNISMIILDGADSYRSIGTEKSPGTKIFALTGKVNNVGLVEVDMGIPLGDIIYDIGGGIPDGKKFKAAQLGGPSGGCVPKEHLNVPVDYESLNKLGAIMGSGGLIVMDNDTCMVDVARFFLEFIQEESCGKCSPCRVGTKRMWEILERICNGQGVEGDVEKLIELGEVIKDTSLCGLGQTAPNPVLSTIRHFRAEYDAHIRDHHCEAGVCPSLVRASCQSACPAGVDVPGFISLVGEKRYAEAIRLHRERNPFAAVCARVCFHTCENKCKRETIDEPISIRGIKRFMIDQEITVQLPEIKENKINAGKKIAIVGAGPAGLSCAYFLARLGYKPHVFESEPRPGGMLVQAIPSYRLPREILAREIRMIEGMGVEIFTGKSLGKDFTINSLKDDGYDAVFIGIGAQKSVKLGIPGEDATNIVDALDFLRQYNLRGSVPVGKKVAIIGGGNAAIDAARTALRLGAENVTVVYRRTKEGMPAYAEEIEEAEQEGVKLQLLTSPIEVLNTDGMVSGLLCHPMSLGDFDKSGRRRPEDKTGKEFTIYVDQVITAIGQKVDAEFLEIPLTDYKTVAVQPKTGQTSRPWVFAGGDVVLGAASVVDAIACGEKSAVGIDTYLTGKDNSFWREDKEVQTAYNPDADPVPYPREKLNLISVDRRKNNFDEVEIAWTESVAIRQSERCLRCDYGKKSVGCASVQEGVK